MPRVPSAHGTSSWSLLAFVYNLLATSAAPTSTMLCAGTEALTRVCLVHDLFYDTKERVFTYYGTGIVNDRGAEPVRANASAFNAATQFLAEPTKGGHFQVRWAAPEDRPDVDDNADTCIVDLPIIFRRDSPFNTHSYGHMLRDNFYHIVTIPKMLGLKAETFAWVTWPREIPPRSQTRRPTHVMSKISSLVSAHDARQWHDVEVDCQTANNVLGPDTESAIPRYIRIGMALLTGASDRRWTQEPGACAAADFTQMRDHAWRRFGIAPRLSQRRSDPIRMVILNKPPGDKRRMIVPPDVLRAVRAAFPQVEVRVHTGHNEEEGVQMQWLSRTDIFVTNIGSASFRMLFLPDGAKVVLAGPLETPFKDETGFVTNIGRSQFREVRDCWQYLPYFKIFKYHVLDKADVTIKPLEKGRITGDREHDARVRLRDFDITLRAEPLLKVLRQAVRSVLNGRGYAEQTE